MRYKDEGEALEKLQDDFVYWSSMLSSRSVEMSYALIAANWAVHGSMQNILQISGQDFH